MLLIKLHAINNRSGKFAGIMEQMAAFEALQQTDSEDEDDDDDVVAVAGHISPCNAMSMLGLQLRL